MNSCFVLVSNKYPQTIMYFKPFKCRVKPRAREFTKIRTYGMRAKSKPNFSPISVMLLLVSFYVVKKLDATFRVRRRAFTIFGKAIHNPLAHGVKRIITHL